VQQTSARLPQALVPTSSMVNLVLHLLLVKMLLLQVAALHFAPTPLHSTVDVQKQPAKLLSIDKEKLTEKYSLFPPLSFFIKSYTMPILCLLCFYCINNNMTR
jgi:hypothetical protein